MSVTYDDVRKKIIELTNNHGLGTAKALLAKYGVTKGPDLQQHQYHSFFVEADNMIHHRWDEPVIEDAPVANQIIDIHVHTEPTRRALWLDVLLFPYILFSVTTFALFMMGYALWQCYVKRRDIKVGW